MAKTVRRHQNDTKTFEELTTMEQALAVNAHTVWYLNAARAHGRRIGMTKATKKIARQLESMAAHVRNLAGADEISTEGPAQQSEPLHAISESTSRPKLAHLLDDQSRKLVSFSVDHKGTFYNKDLAKCLGIDTPLTSIYLGQLTRKLRHVGVDAKNWYAKHRTANGTLLTVREDVLEKFRQAVQR